MKKKLFLTLAILFSFSACTTSNKSVNVPKSEEAIAVKPVKTVKKKTAVKKRPKVSDIEKPKEVARVCFDKKGVAHNCNYKIPKPYLEN